MAPTSNTQSYYVTRRTGVEGIEGVIKRHPRKHSFVVAGDHFDVTPAKQEVGSGRQAAT